MPKSKTYLSPAKLNLGLKVVGKRADGYHLLKTVLCLIDLFDEITLEITNDSKITLLDYNEKWPYQEDLTYKSALLLQQKTGNKLYGCNIKRHKFIPVGAGLGGGSSNAATVLMGLNKLWQTNLSKAELMRLGVQLGADVPFFIYGKPAMASGIGDKFEAIDLPQLYFVLINPNIHISTATVFRELKFDHTKTISSNIDSGYLLKTKENDLQNTAIQIYPKLLSTLKDLQNYGKPTMTGSGSNLYLTYNDILSAKKVAKELQSSYNCYLVKSLKLSPVLSESN